MDPQPTTIDIERRIAADPASAALLIAAPAAAAMWPGLVLDAAEPGELIRVSVTLPQREAALVDLPTRIAAVVRAESPQRTPTAFVMRFSFEAVDLPPTTGTLTLSYASAEGDESIATVARLRFTVAPALAVDGFLRALEISGQAFLGNLADAAEARSRAA